MGGSVLKLLVAVIGLGANAANYTERFQRFAGSPSVHLVGGTWVEHEGVRFLANKHTRIPFEWQAGKELQPGEMPRSGTLEMHLGIISGYSYNGSTGLLRHSDDVAWPFNSGWEDAWWAGTTRILAHSNGKICINVAKMKGGGPWFARCHDTTFRFGKRHTLSFSFGEDGWSLAVNGEVVERCDEFRQTLSGNPLSLPTIGEYRNSWPGWRYRSSAEMDLYAVRVSDRPHDYLLHDMMTMMTPKMEDHVRKPMVLIFCITTVCLFLTVLILSKLWAAVGVATQKMPEVLPQFDLDGQVPLLGEQDFWLQERKIGAVLPQSHAKVNVAESSYHMDTTSDVALLEDEMGELHTDIYKGFKKMFEGSEESAQVVNLRRALDFMLHRYAETTEERGKNEIEDFLRRWFGELTELRYGAASQQMPTWQAIPAFESLYESLSQELMRLNVNAMEPKLEERELSRPMLRRIDEQELSAKGDILGKGMFTVWKASWQQGITSTAVALKTYCVLDDDDEEEQLQVQASRLQKLFDRVEQNAQRQMACAHNNVLRIFGSCRQDGHGGSMKLVMPLITAGSLEFVLQLGQESEIGKMVLGLDDDKRSLALGDLFAGTSAALAHIHGFQPSVVHLDLKPANILLVMMPGGMLQPKLCDFDAARVVQDEASTKATSSSRVAEGTYHYMSPERLRDLPQSDAPAADIYSLAMVMTKCLTGQLKLPVDPKAGPRHVTGLDTNWVIRIFAGERPELPAGTRDLQTYESSIKQCWQSDPSKRPTSATVAAEHLSRLKQRRCLS